MSEFRTIKEIIREALRCIDEHPLVRYPVVFNQIGSPVRITEYRDHDGYDLNPKGITLGVFPYTYSSSSLTADTMNAPLVFRSMHLGDSQNGNETGRINLVVKMTMMGSKINAAPLAEGRPLLQENLYENILRDWLEVMRVILLSNPLQKLGGWVKNSRVMYANFETTDKFASKGENFVLHKATLLWQLDTYPPRSLQAFPYNRVSGWTLGWTFVGLRTADLIDCYWDGDRKDLMTLTGYPIRTTPVDVPVKWNPDQKRFEHRETGEPLTEAQMKDPEAPEGRPWIDIDLKIVGVIWVPPTAIARGYFFNVYLRLSTGKLERADGTLITTLPDGSPIVWDGTKLVVTPKDEATGGLWIDLSDPKAKGVLVRVADSDGKREVESFRVPEPKV